MWMRRKEQEAERNMALEVDGPPLCANTEQVIKVLRHKELPCTRYRYFWL
jgi:hypothetical protein